MSDTTTVSIAALSREDKARYEVLFTAYKAQERPASGEQKAEEIGRTSLSTVWDELKVGEQTIPNPFSATGKELKAAIDSLVIRGFLQERTHKTTDHKFYKITPEGIAFFQKNVAPLLGVATQQEQDARLVPLGEVENKVLAVLGKDNPQAQELLKQLQALYSEPSFKLDNQGRS